MDQENDVQTESQWGDEFLTHHREMFGGASLNDLFHNKGPELVFMQV